MNYRHVFHAGNFADVFKHAVLIGLLEALAAKKTPYCYLETHAGSGRYDLHGADAQKTREHETGVMRLLAATELTPQLHIYMNLVRALNADAAPHDLRIYPGSPMLARYLMREQDRALLCELQPTEAGSLKRLFANDARVQVHQRDGYAAVGALIPPRERRGLVLIDPPFEAQEREFDAVRGALSIALERWPNGIYAIWYPIKLRRTTQTFRRWFVQQGIAKVLCAELLLHPDNSTLRLNGCGMIIVNAPWKFDQQLGALLPVLLRYLSQSRFGEHRVDWLTPA